MGGGYLHGQGGVYPKEVAASCQQKGLMPRRCAERTCLDEDILPVKGRSNDFTLIWPATRQAHRRSRIEMIQYRKLELPKTLLRVKSRSACGFLLGGIDISKIGELNRFSKLPF